MKEKRTYKRFDLYSTLAVLGVLAVLAFECFFVFELYNRDMSSIKCFLPAVEEAAPVPAWVDEPVPVG